MLRVMLDTKYWIDLRYSPETRERFTELTANDEIEVYFSYGNFIDLVKADEQDELSEILAETVDIYIPAMDYVGNTYAYTENPIGLIPDEEVARDVRIMTAGRSEEFTLRTIFRIGDWEANEDRYEEYTQTGKDIEEEYDFEHLMAVAFPDYIEYEDGDEKARLWKHKIDVAEFVRKMAALHRIEVVQDNENIDANDIADIEICSQAIVTECDMLLMESKWRNVELVEKVSAQLTSEEDVEVFDDFEEFLRTLEVYLAGV